VTWYTKGFQVSSEIRAAFMRVETVDELVRLFDCVNTEQPFPPAAMRVIRGKTTGVQKKVALPSGYLDDLEDASPPEGGDGDPGDGG